MIKLTVNYSNYSKYEHYVIYRTIKSLLARTPPQCFLPFFKEIFLKKKIHLSFSINSNSITLIYGYFDKFDLRNK